MMDIESPRYAPDSPMDMIDDGAFPCKGCGDILEEGKAFELAGNRWHIDCFRCNTCGTLLDSDANLLLLGDGSLICNNCTYSCNACGNKIEDLAILTGDQAFCAGCFRCRNCKRKIENLRYARTSQGIFCMSCHESLMARRRKRSKNQPPKSSGSAMDKALPAPPPVDDEMSIISSAKSETPTELSPRPRLPAVNKNLSSGPPSGRALGNVSPSSAYSNASGTPRGSPMPAQSPSTMQEHFHKTGSQTSLQDSKYLQTETKISNKSKRQSMYSHLSDEKTDRQSHDSFASYFPLVLDDGPPVAPLPVPVPTTTPLNGNKSNDLEHLRQQALERERETQKQKDKEAQRLLDAEKARYAEQERVRERELDAEVERQREKGLQRERDRNRQREAEMERERDQERIRQYEADLQRETEKQAERKRLAKEREEAFNSKYTNIDAATPTRDLASLKNQGRSQTSSPALGPTFSPREQLGVEQSDKDRRGTGSSSPQLYPTIERKEVPPRPEAKDGIRSSVVTASPGSSQGNFKLQGVPVTKKATPKLPSSEEHSVPLNLDDIPIAFSTDTSDHHHSGRTQSLPRNELSEQKVLGMPLPRKGADVPTKSFSTPHASSGSKSHPNSRAGSEDTGAGDHYMGSDFSIGSGTTSATTASSGPKEHEYVPTPVPPPQPSTRAFHRPNASQGSTVSAGLAVPAENTNGISPILPPYRPVVDMSFEEEMGKIFGGESSASLLRRVSNAVKHGRSFSDIAQRGGNMQSPKWPRSPTIGGTAPFILPYGVDISSPTSAHDPKEENATLKHALRRSTQHIAELESKLHNTTDLKDLEENIQEKQTTVAVLETQRQTTILELGLLRDRMTNVDNQSVDIEDFKSELIKSLAKQLEDLKASFAPEIEQLIIQRNALLEEVANLSRKRDQAIQETAQLNSKNMQLADLNNELTRRIQTSFSANKTASEGIHMPAASGNVPGSPRLGSSAGPKDASGLKIYVNQLPNASETSVETLRDGPQRPGANSAMSGITITGSMNSISVSDQAIAEETGVVMNAQHIVNIRKPGAQAKKFNWKKGGAAVGKGIGKGFNKIFASDPNQYGDYQDGTSVQGTPYGSAAYGAPPALGDGSNGQRSNGQDQYGQSVFGTQRGLLKKLAKGNNASATTDNPVPLLGSELEARVEYEGRRIPLIITKCLEEVETRGLDLEGIYRKGGGASQMRMIQEAFDRGEDIDLEDPSIDICAVTSVLKQYFRKLPTPLITYNVYDRMVESSREQDDEKRKNLVKGLINELPSLNRDILFFIINHLTKVVAYQSENLMNSRNLAVVFAPTLMRDFTGELELRDTAAKNETLQFIIDNAKAIFAGVDL